MQINVPRLVLAGTNSGCGKTTVTCAVLQALVNRGIAVGAAKCGPDYIDPMFHSRIIGAKSQNLDSFFFDDNTLRFLLAENSMGCDVTVIEGVMGYYDGLGLTQTRGKADAGLCGEILRRDAAREADGRHEQQYEKALENIPAVIIRNAQIYHPRHDYRHKQVEHDLKQLEQRGKHGFLLIALEIAREAFHPFHSIHYYLS